MGSTVVLARSRAQGLYQGLIDQVPVDRLFLVDEVDDDESADVPEPELPGDFPGGLEIGLEEGFLEVAAAHEAPGIDVDGGEGLGGVDDQIAAALEPHPGRQEFLPVDFQAEMTENGLGPGIEFNPEFFQGAEGFQIVGDALKTGGVVHQDPVHLGGVELPDHPPGGLQFLVEEAGAGGACPFCAGGAAISP